MLKGVLRAAVDNFADDDPRIVVAEDSSVLLVSRRIRRNFAQFNMVLSVGRIQNNDAVL